jgi:hypothetical protein
MFSLAGPLSMYWYAPFVVTFSAAGKLRPIYRDLYTISGYGEGYFFQYGYLHNLRIESPPSP